MTETTQDPAAEAPAADAAPAPFATDKAANVAVAREWLANGLDPLRVAGWLADTCPDHFDSVTDAEKELGL